MKSPKEIIYFGARSVLWTLACILAGASQAGEVSLLQVVRLAMERYPAAQAARAQVAGAQAEQDKAEAARWPVLSLGASAQQASSGSTTRSATPQASYTLYAGGGIEAGVARAVHLVRAAQGKAANTQDEVAQQAAEAYLLWARGLAQKELADRHLQALRAIADDVRKIVEVDAGRAVDLTQAEVRVNAASLVQVQREVEVQQARARLSRYLDGQLPRQPAGLGVWPGTMPTSLEDALSFAGPQHPLLEQASASLDAAREAVLIARAQILPKVDLVWSRQINPFSLQASNVQQINLNMPVLNGGAGLAGVRSAVEQVQAAQSTLEEQSLVLRERIGNAWADWAMARQRAQINEDQAQVGDRLVESYRMQFRLARRSLLDLLNVQNEAYGYSANAIQVRFDEYLSGYRLLAALGVLARDVKAHPAS